VHILHNLDDFFAVRKSIEALKEALGDQVTLYPYGGHLGNLWYPENKKTVLRFFPPYPESHAFSMMGASPETHQSRRQGFE
jgi:hypothetical protein